MGNTTTLVLNGSVVEYSTFYVNNFNFVTGCLSVLLHTGIVVVLLVERTLRTSIFHRLLISLHFFHLLSSMSSLALYSVVKFKINITYFCVSLKYFWSGTRMASSTQLAMIACDRYIASLPLIFSVKFNLQRELVILSGTAIASLTTSYIFMPMFTTNDDSCLFLKSSFIEKLIPFICFIWLFVHIFVLEVPLCCLTIRNVHIRHPVYNIKKEKEFRSFYCCVFWCLHMLYFVSSLYYLS